MITAGISDDVWAEILAARDETDAAFARLVAMQSGGAS
jgi:hypothetical protein